ncbi:MAG: L-threonylcarbamoyladenylate synthase [Flammeovirgaceae bacterium]|nr:L-threonylcarbamoyladenylate synthase [Flammeovirgaceae bacterium]
MSELITIHPDTPQEQKLQKVVACLKDGGLVIYPTDTVYAIGCDLFSKKGLERLCLWKGIKPDKLNLSFICYDLSDISFYVKHLSNPMFKLMKKVLPGPYTFIFEASGNVPKIIDAKKKQVGIRIPNHKIPREIVRLLGNPLVSASLKEDDEILEYATDPELIYEKHKKTVDIVIDGGFGGTVPSTVVSCLDNKITIIREGMGDTSVFE